ncbi:uncharacterized protein LOC142328846 isoform X3 [Lycorma delicatula]|uniref:uncharacterized protein LOC142328846 isoform X3 n=1 Tax=Lycorma delicatula TaxID=130591 RepID=UPI003F50FF45
MQLELFYYTAIFSALIKISQTACVVKPNSAIISALLPLHSGSDCSTVELRGLQQAAALQATVNSLNSDIKKESNILINLKIQDTCSSEDGAVKAALKSMVDSDQTCLHPPLFMGFIGPEVKQIIDAVHQVTKLFNGTHIIPYAIDTSNEAILHITAKQSLNQAQSLITILNQLKWTTFSLAIDDSAEIHILAKNILELLQENPTLCVTDSVARITDAASISEALVGSTGHGIVVLADSPETVSQVLQINKLLGVPLVLIINKIGIQNWQIPSVNSTLVILQGTVSHPIDGVAESVNVTMYSAYLKQQDQMIRDTQCKNAANINTCMQNIGQDVFQGSLDPSLQPLTYAARLMGSSLLAAHKAKCHVAGSESPVPGLCSRLSRIPASEWRAILLQSTADIKQIQNVNLPPKIHFQMNIPDTLDIYVRNQINLVLEKIGQVSNGNLKLLNGQSFPTQAGNDMKVKQKECPTNRNLQVLPTVLITASKSTPAVMLQPVEGHEENEFYEMSKIWAKGQTRKVIDKVMNYISLLLLFKKDVFL